METAAEKTLLEISTQELLEAVQTHTHTRTVASSCGYWSALLNFTPINKKH